MTLQPQKLFLIDSTGAFLSAFLLGVVLVSLERSFGMPRNVLYFLSISACMLGIYSFMCYVLLNEHWKPYLQMIAFANLLYCCLTIGLVLYWNKALTNLGLLYFLSEVGIVITLALVELKTASRQMDHKF